MTSFCKCLYYNQPDDFYTEICCDGIKQLYNIPLYFQVRMARVSATSRLSMKFDSEQEIAVF